ncbi:MAG: hypothetical protein OXF02_01620 [Simkaniaceae bacterium]|nr:hypothetical protein [Simkaniaceae bacterium]
MASCTGTDRMGNGVKEITEREVSRMRDELLRISSALDSTVCETESEAEMHLDLAFASDNVSRKKFAMMPGLSGIVSLTRNIDILRSEIAVASDMTEEGIVRTRNRLKIATYAGESAAYLGVAVSLFMQCNPLVPCAALAVGKGCAGARMCTMVTRRSGEDILHDLRILREASEVLRGRASWMEMVAREYEGSSGKRVVEKGRISTFREETKRYLRVEENRVKGDETYRKQPLSHAPFPV